MSSKLSLLPFSQVSTYCDCARENANCQCVPEERDGTAVGDVFPSTYDCGSVGKLYRINYFMSRSAQVTEEGVSVSGFVCVWVWESSETKRLHPPHRNKGWKVSLLLIS